MIEILTDLNGFTNQKWEIILQKKQKTLKIIVKASIIEVK